MNDVKRIVIVGGGISGLSTAFYLSQAIREKKIPPAEICLLESDHRLGGVIRSEKRDGFLLEYGPDSFTSEKPAVLNLCHQLGIENQIIGTRPEFRGSSILQNRKFMTVPEGFYMLAPIDLKTLWSNPLLSWKGKLRLLAEPMIPPAKIRGDESLGDFVSRRFGHEVMERIAQPMLGNIYGGNLKDLSLLASMPRLRDMEQTSGSVARAILQKKKNRQLPMPGTKPKYGMFLSFQEGMETLVKKLIVSLFHVRIRTGVKVEEIRFIDHQWKLHLSDESNLDSDLLCLALPSPQSGELLSSDCPDLGRALSDISYRSMTTLHLGLRRTALLRAYHQYGFMISPEIAKSVLSASFASNKFVNRAPEDFYQIRVFGTETLASHGAFSEKEISQKIWDEFSAIMDVLDPSPVFSVLTHWKTAIPRYQLGHLNRVAAIEQEASRFPSLFLTGNAFRGVGISDCVKQSEVTSEKMIAYLQLLMRGTSPADNPEPFLPSAC